MLYRNIIGVSIQNQTEFRNFVPNAEATNVINGKALLLKLLHSVFL